MPFGSQARLAFLVAVPLVLGASGPAAERPIRPSEPRPFPPAGKVDPGKITPPLADHLAGAKDSEFIPIVLVFERQLSPPEKAKVLGEVGSKKGAETKKARRQALTRELRRLSQVEQAPVLKVLEGLERQQLVMHVKPLWISNVIGLKARRGAIEQLSAQRGIASIHLDLPRPVKGQVWGVTQIRADQVWALTPTAFNGTGVTVAILDTGVDYTHTDLAGRMWINAAEDLDGDGRFTAADVNGVDDDGNGFVDDVIGWNFAGAGSNDPADVNGHGTHVAGTVAGDGAGGTHTGVAPGARIMALRESSTIGLSTQQECWAGMQYALANGADIVNFSSGWLDTWSPVYATWRNTVSNLMDGGVLFVTIAHNDSSATGAPDNVRTPGRVPLALTVGATDDTDTIAGFSNNGPVTWQAVSPWFDYPWPPGLMKPDVSAPGVNVNSTIMGGGYSGNTWSGTSMAAPHVAGAAALLLDEDPGLTPYDLKFILEETSVDLGVAGPDNAYGWGRIDALAGINHTLNTAAYDLSVTGTNALWTTDDIWVDNDDDGTPDTPQALANNHLYARIRNVGGQVVSDVEVKFYYADVSTLGISGFDPNGDGDPADGNFTYIGSYRIPTLGPAGSRHESAVALVNWNIPVPPGTHWCVGIGIVAHDPPNAPEANRSNNAAFRNFFEILTSTTAFEFTIFPPPRAPDRPFSVEFLKRNLPKGVQVELVVDRAAERRLLAKPAGFERLAEPLLDPKMKPLGAEYLKVLGQEVRHVRYRVEGDRALLGGIVSPKGEPFRVRLVVTTPPKVKTSNESLLVINTLDQGGKAVGGLTLKVVAKH